MELNKNTLTRMLAMNDEELWRMIRLIASAAGIRLSEGPAPAAEMEKVRTALASVSGEDVAGALSILAKYKK